MSIVLRFFPNGEFSQGVDTSKKRRDRQRRDTPTQISKLDTKRRDEYFEYTSRFHPSLSHWAMHSIGSQYSSPNLYTYTLRESSQTHCVLEWRDIRDEVHFTTCSENIASICFQWRLTPLVHQLVESCENAESLNTTSSRKKLESMTKSMARNIRNAVYLLEQGKGGKDCLSFLTLTLPDLSSEGLAQCCQNWDYMVKRFIDWLRTKVEACNIEFSYVYCTEIQTKRLEIRHEYSPHLHLVFKGRDGKKQAWAITPRQARKAWGACIASVVNEPFRRNALENLQRIKHSAARYLGKYLSKGAASIPKGAPEDTIQTLRTQWGGMARELSRKVKKHTTRINGTSGHYHIVNAFIKCLSTLVNIGYILYYKSGFIPLHKDELTGNEYGLHVCSGCLSIPTYRGGLDPILAYLSHELQFHDCYE